MKYHIVLTKTEANAIDSLYNKLGIKHKVVEIKGGYRIDVQDSKARSVKGGKREK